MAFDKAKFLAPVAAETATVETATGPLTVRALTCDEYDRFEVGCTVTGPDGKRAYKTDRAMLVRMAAVDPETGGQVFGDEDLPALRARSAKELSAVASAALKLCQAEGDGGN